MITILNDSTGMELCRAVRTEQVSPDGEIRQREQSIPSEHLMEVWVNDRLTMKVTCTGKYLPELVLGRLLTEDIIESAGDVEEIRICSSGLTARVYLREGSGENKLPEESEAVSTTPTCCTGNRILDHYYASGRQLRHLEPFSWKADWISALSEDAERPENFPLYAATHSVHGCSLLCGGIIQFRCEDIGRHNALDKAIGYALIEGIDLSRSALFTTGRVPTDMALKAIRAGVPVLSARKAPTAEAVKLAGEYGLAILQTGKQGLVKIWSGGRTCDRSIGIKALNRSTRIKI